MTDDAETAIYPVLEPLLRDGERYGPPSGKMEIALSDADADRLIASGVIGNGGRIGGFIEGDGSTALGDGTEVVANLDAKPEPDSEPKPEPEPEPQPEPEKPAKPAKATKAKPRRGAAKPAGKPAE